MNNKTMNSKEIKSGLKTLILMNNKTMNSKEINSGLKTAILMNNKTMSTKEIKSGLKTSILMNNKTMNSKEIKSGLKTAILMNNKTMNSKEIKSCLNGSNLMNYKIMDNHILDEPIPHIGVATLSPTPFRRKIQSLRDTARKAANTAKRKWNEYYDWLGAYVPPPIRVPPKSLEGSALRNNNILDEPVPHIGIETLRPTPFRRRIEESSK